MATAGRDLVTRGEQGILHRRFRAPDGALIGTLACPAIDGEMAIGANAWWVIDDVDAESLCGVCWPRNRAEPLT